MNNKIFKLEAKIISNKRQKENYWHCILDAEKIAQSACPGQFVNIQLDNHLEVLLRRPFGVHKVSGSRIELLYEVLGKGTEIFSRKKAGESLDIIGPLGNGFSYNSGAGNQKLPIIIAGGMGVAPLVFLAKKLTAGKTKNEKGKTLVLIGAKNKDQILCEKEFKDLGCSVKIATDDGSAGFKGYISKLLNSELSTIDYRLPTIYACGPKSMLKEIAKIALQHKIPGQISLEEHLACGIGACLGCVVNTKYGYRRVCKEGPVFKAEEIIW